MCSSFAFEYLHILLLYRLPLSNLTTLMLKKVVLKKKPNPSGYKISQFCLFTTQGTCRWNKAKEANSRFILKAEVLMSIRYPPQLTGIRCTARTVISVFYFWCKQVEVKALLQEVRTVKYCNIESAPKILLYVATNCYIRLYTAIYS